MTMLRRVIMHPWRMRRWLRQPRDLWNILRREREHKDYERREGHPFYGPVPPDSWPTPVPDGYGHVFRCAGCGRLGFYGSHTSEQGCLHCDSSAGVIVGKYGRFPERETEDNGSKRN